MCDIQSSSDSWTDSSEGGEHHVLATLLDLDLADVVDNSEWPIVPVLTDQDLAAVADLPSSESSPGLDDRARPVERIARALLSTTGLVLQDCLEEHAMGRSGLVVPLCTGRPLHVRKTKQGSDC